jgi:hypothetical protein
MNHHFRLSVVRVQCIHEQLREWGKDEMRLIAYGVGRRGAPYATGYRSLGSYGEGDVRTGGELPLVLFEGELPSDGLDNVLFLWLVEQDGSGVRDAAPSLDAQFMADFSAEAAHLTEIGFPRDCVPFTAFYKAVLPHGDRIEKAGTKGRNDEVYAPIDLFFRFQVDGPAFLQVDQERVFERSKNLGHYRVTLRASWTAQPVILG